MTFKIISSVSFMFFLLFSSGAYAATTIESSGKGVVIRSDVSATADTGGNSGSGNITTGSATAGSRTVIRSSGNKTEVKVEATAETDEGKSSVSVGQDGSGTVSVQEKDGGTETEVEISVSDIRDVPAMCLLPDSDGLFPGVMRFFRSIFE
ncbi:MAG: hypothetical protein KBD19_02780 [Candidatus Moranbacteria bacterium]|nr:hypothetical protein [Candidatus Moranbacteria bacterium]